MLFIETPAFTRQITALLSDDEYGQLQQALIAHPESGVLIRDTGGLRKLRWRVSGRGKSGGLRVIYYWVTANHHIRLLLVYRKGIKDNLTAAERQTLRAINERWQPANQTASPYIRH